ncbi:hypothetical protein H696_03400 [Fonticula alba]|uniref:Ras-GAP domain-containing protein n=1 Tax=Fonticula alba TaxID=691883 RepID=A0A058Z6Q1_FONAL|nr:hypothetical protein H696_03400 [Fonticula alba]KCV69935.1 hypothetical protein H696_03400 [Fonticula alba]|eukprot:XP_009495541.1 hypothetical protein H696_03400 [Fonticula alba]
MPRLPSLFHFSQASEPVGVEALYDDLVKIKQDLSSLNHRNFELRNKLNNYDKRIGFLVRGYRGGDELDFQRQLDDEPAMQGFSDPELHDNYAKLFYMFQTNPQLLGILTRAISTAEVDPFLQTMLFTIFGHQYETREESLLLLIIQVVLRNEFNDASEQQTNSILRANTNASRVLSTYTRRGPGQSYLQSLLSAPISELVRENADLEINPTKLFASNPNLPPTEGFSGDNAHLDPVLQPILQPRLNRLCFWIDTFINAILESLATVPFGLRWICKQIMLLTKERFPSESDELFLSLVGGFYMLRFVNPAIVTPSAYMHLSESVRSVNAKRSLTLIAKVIQSITNQVLQSKETYMSPLNEHLSKHRKAMVNFYRNLCVAEDIQPHHLYLSSPHTATLSITINEVYMMHGLIVKYRDAIPLAEDDPLHAVLKALGEPPAALARAKNFTTKLKLPIPTDIDTAVQPTHTAVNLYDEVRSLLVKIVRYADRPFSDELVSSGIYSILLFGSNVQVHKEIPEVTAIARVKLSQLLTEGPRTAEEIYRQLVADIQSDMDELNRIRKEMETEYSALEKMYRFHADFYAHIEAQIKSYEDVLTNVSQPIVQPAPHKFSHVDFEREKIIASSTVPEYRKGNTYFELCSAEKGSFMVTLMYKGRPTPLCSVEVHPEQLLRMHKSAELVSLTFAELFPDRLYALIQKTLSKR